MREHSKKSFELRKTVEFLSVVTLDPEQIGFILRIAGAELLLMFQLAIDERQRYAPIRFWFIAWCSSDSGETRNRSSCAVSERWRFVTSVLELVC